jgi:thiol-disulfide isomerase/thioredoxin
VLESAIATYREAPELAGRVAFSIEFPDGRKEEKRMDYGRRGSDAFLALVLPDGSRVLELVAIDGRIFASQFNVARAHVDAPYAGDLLVAMDGIGATQVGLKLPPPLAAAMTGEVAPFLDALGFGVLPAPEVSGMRRVTTADGAAFEINLRAENGTADVTVHEASRRLLGFSLAVGEPGHQVLGHGTFVEADPAELDAGLAFDPAGRQPVADFAALEASAYPLGQPAPEASLPTLKGETVSLTELEGSVVVLDFWATWCVPCWSALEEIQGLAEWAADSDLPVAVYAVSTQETMPDLEQQRFEVNRFLTGRSLSLPVLLDVDDSFFAAMHSPGLPSTVIIAPDGTLARYHSGLVPDMLETLKREVEELGS